MNTRKLQYAKFALTGIIIIVLLALWSNRDVTTALDNIQSDSNQIIPINSTYSENGYWGYEFGMTPGDARNVHPEDAWSKETIPFPDQFSIFNGPDRIQCGFIDDKLVYISKWIPTSGSFDPLVEEVLNKFGEITPDNYWRSVRKNSLANMWSDKTVESIHYKTRHAYIYADFISLRGNTARGNRGLTIEHVSNAYFNDYIHNYSDATINAFTAAIKVLTDLINDKSPELDGFGVILEYNKTNEKESWEYSNENVYMLNTPTIRIQKALIKTFDMDKGEISIRVFPAAMPEVGTSYFLNIKLGFNALQMMAADIAIRKVLSTSAHSIKPAYYERDALRLETISNWHIDKLVPYAQYELEQNYVLQIMPDGSFRITMVKPQM